MSIAGVLLSGFEPFRDQVLKFGPRASTELADVHFFVGQNGTGKTRLLSLLAAACGNPAELQRRSDQFSSTVVASVKQQDGTEHLRAFVAPQTAQKVGPLLSASFGGVQVQGAGPSPSLMQVSNTIAMAFRSIPALEDQKLAPMGEVKWAEPKSFLEFAHHSTENVQLCQSLANLKVRMGIVSSNPNDRAVRMLHAFDEAIRSITSKDLILSVKYVGKEFRLIAIWGKDMQLKQLPDGLRSIVGWLASVLCKLDMLLPDVELPLQAPITLLLDEPDAYLHPAWQRKLIPAVQRMLPNAQIFVATHSPFVVSSVNAGWIYIFEADGDSKVTIKPPKRCSPGDSYIDVVEDVLGIRERFDPETEALLADFRSKRDAVKRQPSDDSLNELQSLAEQIAKRSETLQFMMGREMAQLKSQIQVATA